MTSLIVRVKRRRSELPSNELVVVEDERESKRKTSLKSLSLSNDDDSEANNGVKSNTNNTSKLVLRRMGTIKEGSGDREAIDVSKKRDRAPSIDIDGEGCASSSEEPRSKRLFVTRRRRVVRSKKDGEYVVVDLSQITHSDSAPSGNAAVHKSNTVQQDTYDKKPSLKRAMILNPPDRHFENALNNLSGIELKRRGGAVLQADFNPLLTALMQGGNVNLQTRKSSSVDTLQGDSSADTSDASVTGKTALMLACYFGNHRLASRLVARGADALLTDSKGRIAMDYLHEGLKQRGGTEMASSVDTLQRTPHAGALNSSMEELVLLLNKTASKSIHEREILASIVSDSRSVRTDTAPEDRDEDYVVDIFATDTTLSCPSSETASDEDGVETKARGNFGSELTPLVAIEGLRIDGASNTVDFVEFDYDSDWSDLGDDEDPDSNDERYHGNDYPEEESEQEKYDTDSDSNSDHDDDDDDGHECAESDRNFRRMPAKLTKLGREGVRSSGHVIRHQVGGEYEGEVDLGNVGVPTPESILRTWQREEAHAVEGEEDEEAVLEVKNGGPRSLKEHRDRLRALREQRGGIRDGSEVLGTQFGSNPREFGRNALPKYQGLSDSEDEDESAAYEKYGYRAGWDDSQNDAQFSRFAQDTGMNSSDDDDDDDGNYHDDNANDRFTGGERSDEGYSYGGANRIVYGDNSGLFEEDLVAQARATRAFYNGLRDDQHSKTNGDVFRLGRGVMQKRY